MEGFAGGGGTPVRDEEESASSRSTTAYTESRVILVAGGIGVHSSTGQIYGLDLGRSMHIALRRDRTRSDGSLIPKTNYSYFDNQQGGGRNPSISIETSLRARTD